MKLIIKDINRKQKTFYCYINNEKVGFYLTNRLSKIFLDSLDIGIMVNFEISNRKKVINKRSYHQVLHFNEIINLRTKKFTYNHKKLKNDMVDFLMDKEYFLFLDLEMTIPFPRQKGFVPEIVQYGLYLTDKKGNNILDESNYLKTVRQNPVSRRTFKFLSIDSSTYTSQAKDYDVFYNLLKELMEKYNPKIIVWGKNDIIAINHSYNIYNKEEVTTNNDFVDLLKLHKDYFNLINDLGLFKAYETYYDRKFVQLHDAKADAKVTKKVFHAFFDYSINEMKKANNG